MSWSAFQREMLAAMDLRPYRLATTPAADSGQAADAAAPRADARPRSDARGGDLSRVGHASIEQPRIEPPRVDPLIAALLRAAGREIDTPTLLEWADGLRGNARAKRALWPRLRALRRSGA